MGEETYQAIRELFPVQNPFTSLKMAEIAGLITPHERLNLHCFADDECENTSRERFRRLRKLLAEQSSS